jgi:hypothetical protein
MDFGSVRLIRLVLRSLSCSLPEVLPLSLSSPLLPPLPLLLLLPPPPLLPSSLPL